MTMLLLFIGAIHFYHRAWVTLTLEEEVVRFFVPYGEVGVVHGTTTEETLPSSERVGSLLTKAIAAHDFTIDRDSVVPSQGTTYQTARASGTIEIRNYWSETPLSLVRRTRFEAPNGVIFRTQETVTVPGFQRKGGTIVPGVARVWVEADEPGEEGNIQKGTPLLVAAFAGRPQYERVSAVAVEAFSGGFKGEVPVIAPEVRDATIAKEQQFIEEHFASLPEVRSALKNERLIPGTLHVQRVVSRAEPLGGNAARLRLQFYLRAFTYNPEALNRALLASHKVEGTIRESIVTYDPQERQFLVEAYIQPSIDPSVVAESFAGAHRYEISRLMNRAVPVAAVREGSVRIFPFWRTSLPADPKRISVTVHYVPPQRASGSPVRGEGVDN